jgi:hypothetical protein
VDKLGDDLYSGWDPEDLSPHPIFWLGGVSIGDEDVKKSAVSVVRQWDRSLVPKRRHRGPDAISDMARLVSEITFVGSFFVLVPIDRLERLEALVMRSAEEHGLAIPIGAEMII